MCDAGPDLSDVFDRGDGLPRPRWDAIGTRIEAGCEAGRRREAWVAVGRRWLAELGHVQNRKFSTTESDHFQILALHAGGAGDRLARFAERCRVTLLGRLPGVADFEVPGKQVVVAFHDAEDYYRYISAYYPEGRHGGSAGVHVREGYPHVVLHGRILDLTENTLAHELTHAALHHLSMPLWLEEGIAQTIEHDVTGQSFLSVDSRTGERHKRHWGGRGLDDFWSGAGFSRAGKVQGLCYQLAEILVRLLLEEARPRWFGWVQAPRHRLTAFLRAARAADCGEAAYRECMGEELADLAGRFLGPGPWAPSPDLPPAPTDLPATNR